MPEGVFSEPPSPVLLQNLELSLALFSPIQALPGSSLGIWFEMKINSKFSLSWLPLVPLFIWMGEQDEPPHYICKGLIPSLLKYLMLLAPDSLTPQIQHPAFKEMPFGNCLWEFSFSTYGFSSLLAVQKMGPAGWADSKWQGFRVTDMDSACLVLKQQL